MINLQLHLAPVGYMKALYKTFIVSLVMIITFTVLSIDTVMAFSAGVLNCTIDDLQTEIKSGSKFSFYVCITSDEDIGYVSGSIGYDSNIVGFRKAALKDKSDNDFFDFIDTGEEIKFIYMNKKELLQNKRISLTFTNTNKDARSCEFFTKITEASNKNKESLLPGNTTSEILNFTGSTGYKTESSKSNLASSQSSKENSKTEKTSNSSKSSSVKSKAADKEQEKIIEYSIVKAENGNQIGDKIFIVVLSAAVLLVVFISAFALGRKTSKEDKERKEEEKLEQEN